MNLLRMQHLFRHVPILVLLLALGVGAALAQTREYTLDADFDEGTLINVNHDAPNNDQLQLNQIASTFPFVNIAASVRGTVVRIDVNTGAILGEYQTAPDGRGRNPSRTTVDQLGNVWVANRDEFDGGLGSVVRIGLITGGTRVDENGDPDANGQFLAPPFDYNTCVDQDSDGLIKTSRGLGDILPWTNPGGVDDNGGVTSAEDECTINYTRVTGTGTRTVAIDANNDVWVGGTGDRDHEKLDGVTGQPVVSTQINFGCGGYGGLIDGNGVLWSAQPLLRYDPGVPSNLCFFAFDRGDYGLGIDPNTGHIWHSSLFSNGVDGPCCRLYELDGAGNVVNSYLQPFGAQGVAVDGNSHVWVAEIFGTQVAHYAPDPLNPGTHLLVGIVTGFAGTTGVAVDANGKIWASENSSSLPSGPGGRGAARIDPTAGPIGGGGYNVGAIDLTVGLEGNDPGGNPLPFAGPYNYSDMTGFVSFSTTAPQGTWNVVYDTEEDDTDGCTISWNGEPQGAEPPGTSITVEARAANTEAGLSSETFVAVTNGTDPGLVGHFIEVRTTLARDPGVVDTPVLSDLTIACNLPPVCDGAYADPDEVWPPNHKFVDVHVLGVTDPDGDPVTITVDGITQDEPLDTFGDGSFEPDGAGVGTATAQVRAERSGTKKVPGNGRVYEVSFTADDGQGGECTGAVQVCVPHDRRPGHACIDDGRLYDSTGGVTPKATTAEVLQTVAIDAYPNPFNPAAELTFHLPETNPVRLAVYDVLGREVRTLVDGVLPAGEHRATFDAGNLPSGVYLYRLEAGAHVVIGTMTLVK